MRLAAHLALVLAACTPDPPGRAATAPPPPSAPVPPSGAPANSAAAAAPPSSASAPALPAAVTVCEAAKARHGAWQPTLDEVVAAATVLPTHCFRPKDRPPAIRACAARLGTATVKVGVGSLMEGVICEESFLPASWDDRRWIVLEVSTFANAAATGSVYTAELRGTKATRYVDNESLADCGAYGRAPSGPPADWPTLPVDLRRFLCGQYR